MTLFRSRIIPPQLPVERAPDEPIAAPDPDSWAPWEWPRRAPLPFDVELTDWLEDGFPPVYEPPKGRGHV